jgi:D-proline reductase (dithiol) PrdB
MKNDTNSTYLRPFVRLKHQTIAKMITRFPTLATGFINAYTPWESEDIPWTPAPLSLQRAHVALVTTAGVHHRDQKPFDMHDPNGDPTFRGIDRTRILGDYVITHDYYDHSDADKDVNVVFPLARLLECESAGNIGRVADTHYSFMGHIDGPHIYSLVSLHAQEIAQQMKTAGVNIALLTPG